MTKIMLVEDDKSLREIYGVRLLAEGYDIVSAGDGEEALAVAIKERPSLIISDVMMPKISGFDMLDILRSTTETRGVKVIMMTALSSEEQRARGEQLGADRYLVKSQVGIEDVVRVVHEVLGDAPGFTPGQAQATASAQTPAAPQPQSYQSPQLATEPTTSSNPTALPQQRPVNNQPNQPVPPRPQAQPAPQPNGSLQAAQQDPAQASVQPAPAQASINSNPTPSTGRSKVIQPISDPHATKVNINDLLDKELAKEAGVDINNRPPVATTDQERAIIDNQVNQFANQQANQTPATQETLPDVQISQNGDFASKPPITPPTQSSDSTNRPITPPPPRPPVAL